MPAVRSSTARGDRLVWPWRRRRPRSTDADRPAGGPAVRPRATVPSGASTPACAACSRTPRRLQLAVVGVDSGVGQARPGSGAGRTSDRGGTHVLFLPVARIEPTGPRCVPSRPARRRPPALPRPDPARAVRPGAPGGRRASPACSSAARWSTASTPRSAACSGPRPTRSGVRRAALHRRLDRGWRAARGGGRVQPRLRRVVRRWNPRTRLRAHLVRPGGHRAGARAAPARGRLGRPPRGAQGPALAVARVRRARRGRPRRAVDARGGRLGSLRPASRQLVADAAGRRGRPVTLRGRLAAAVPPRCAAGPGCS